MSKINGFWTPWILGHPEETKSMILYFFYTFPMVFILFLYFGELFILFLQLFILSAEKYKKMKEKYKKLPKV